MAALWTPAEAAHSHGCCIHWRRAAEVEPADGLESPRHIAPTPRQESFTAAVLRGDSTPGLCLDPDSGILNCYSTY
jgi:hypothetical protein